MVKLAFCILTFEVAKFTFFTCQLYSHCPYACKNNCIVSIMRRVYSLARQGFWHAHSDMRHISRTWNSPMCIDMGSPKYFALRFWHVPKHLKNEATFRWSPRKSTSFGQDMGHCVFCDLQCSSCVLLRCSSRSCSCLVRCRVYVRWLAFRAT